MRVAFIAAVCSSVTFCGCASNQAYKPTPVPQSSGGISEDAPSGLGFPAPTIPEGSSSSSSTFGPTRRSAPKLGPQLPAARRDVAGGNPRAAQLHAPEPGGAGKSADPDARTISGFERPLILDNPGWTSAARSTERRALKTMVLGSGSRHLVVMSSLHGDEQQSVFLIEELARCLKNNPELLRQTTILLIKTPNPDGTAAKSPYNSRGVDLNRNFPAPNWAALDNRRAGSRAGSELETQAVIRLLSDFKPTLLVHVKDSRTTGFINFEGAAGPRAEHVAGLISAQVLQGSGSRTTGSVESWALTRLSCPSLTLLLPREGSDEAAWAANNEALLSLLAPVSESQRGTPPRRDEQVNSIQEQPDPFEDSLSRNSSRSRRQPTVRNTAKTESRNRLPEFPSPVPEHGYLELPPP